MNVEIANRLVQLRKKYGYSQEELAEKLNISRQAVSKWERAEASPDTDNLITLAKLYNISLDELLFEDKPHQEQKEESEVKSHDEININMSGIHLKSEDGDQINIGPGGIHIIDKDDTVVINKANVIKDKKYLRTKETIGWILILLITIAYILLGSLLGLWNTAWILFVLYPTLISIYPAIHEKKYSTFNYPCLVTSVYLFLGMVYGLWHPYWVLFITVPLFYSIGSIFKKDKDDDDYIEVDDIDE